MEADGRHPGISDKELMVWVVGILACIADRPETVLFIGGDNRPAVCWIAKGETRGEFPRKLLIGFLFWCVGGR